MYPNQSSDPPILGLCGSNEFIKLSEASYPLGVDADVAYESAVRKLEKGDCLVLYTDGSMFGTCRLTEILEKCLDDEPDSIVNTIFAAVEEFSDHQTPTDDRTLVVARVK